MKEIYYCSTLKFNSISIMLSSPNDILLSVFVFPCYNFLFGVNYKIKLGASNSVFVKSIVILGDGKL